MLAEHDAGEPVPADVVGKFLDNLKRMALATRNVGAVVAHGVRAAGQDFPRNLRGVFASRSGIFTDPRRPRETAQMSAAPLPALLSWAAWKVLVDFCLLHWPYTQPLRHMALLFPETGPRALYSFLSCCV